MFRMVLSAKLIVAMLLVGLAPAVGRACPFCSAVSQTLSEEISSMDAVVIARLAKTPRSKTGEAPDEVSKGTFEIKVAVRGESHLLGTRTVETVYFGGGAIGDEFLIMGVGPPKIAWSTPIRVSGRAAAYVRSLSGLPKKGADRLAFFQDYLEDEDAFLSQDAYDEFARAPYKEVMDLKDKMDHDQIVRWIKDLEIPASRRRLYFVMLSICGGPDDLPMLEEMLKSDDRKTKAGLDAMIGGYLALTGPDGMPLIEELFLKNKEAEYADTYAAIMALRFHGTETTIIPRKRILEGLRHILDRPQLADLIIPDLARWEDWSQVERLVELFKNVDEKTSWVRVPIINYLLQCPKPEAKKYIEELKKIDADAVKRASTFFPFGGGGGSPSGNESSAGGPAAERTAAEPLARADWERNPAVSGEIASASSLSRSIAWPSREREWPLSNPFHLLGVLWLAGAVMMFAQWRILAGAGRRY